ncbi:diacylglycerol kinase family protein [Acetobacter estunensis]|uniref:diacylglycerol/lipid kinase family protein n=1 Tax=Acetobacter estunensis TaxID=104097 RepID=UPI001C2D75D5|nr:diacylglycerol kinase [Acetobacter estunensis]
MPSSVALIHNSRSRLNIHDGGAFAREARALFGDNFIEPKGQSELSEAMVELARREVQLIVINGGDGTVSNVLSALLVCWPQDRLPALAVIPSGNTNLIASDVGCPTRGLPALALLREKVRTGTLMDDVRWRHPVVVSWSDPKRRPVAGMFGGMAAFTRGIEIAHAPAILDRYSHDTAVLMTIFYGLRQFLRAEVRQKWMAGTPMTLTVDGQTSDIRSRFLFLVTGLHRLSRGVWPFWLDTPARGSVIYLDIAGNPPGLARGLLSVLRGRISQRLRRSAAYHSGMAAEIMIETHDRLVMDGEELAPGEDGRVWLREGPRLAFIQC